MAGPLKPYVAETPQQPYINGGQEIREYLVGRGGQAEQELGQAVLGAGESQTREIENQDIRNVQVQSAQIHAGAIKQIDDAVTSGADLNAVQEKIQDQYYNLSNNASTTIGQKAAAIAQADSLGQLQHVIHSAIAARAGVEAQTAADSWMSAHGAILTQDPSQLADSVDQAKTFTATFTNLSPEYRQKLAQNMEERLNYAAGRAMVEADPEAMKTRLQNGDLTLSNPQRQELLTYSDQVKRGKLYDEERARASRKQAMEDASQQRLTELLPKLTTVPRVALLNDPNLTPRDKENAIDFQERLLTTPHMHSDPARINDLGSRVGLPPDNPRHIGSDNFNAVVQPMIVAKQITLPDAVKLKSEMLGLEADKPMAHAVANAKNVGRSMLLRTIEGQAMPDVAEEASYRMGVDLDRMVKTEQDAGRDPNQTILNPKDKNYFLDPRHIQTYMQSAQQLVAGKAAEIKGKEAPHVTDEASYAAVPPGGTYVDPQGHLRVKPGQSAPEKPAEPLPPFGFASGH